VKDFDLSVMRQMLGFRLIACHDGDMALK